MGNQETVTGELVPVANGTAQVVRVDPDVRAVVVEAWINAKRSQHTRDAYRTDIAQYFAWCDGTGVDVFDARRQHIDLYAAFLDGRDLTTRYPAKRKYQEATQARKITAVSSFYDYAVGETTLIVANPVDRVERPDVDEDSTTNGLDVDQSRKLIAAAQDESLTAEVIVRLLLTTGMRVSELCEASTSDLGWNGTDRVIVVTRKGRKKARLLIGERAAALLDRYLGTRRGPLLVKNNRPMNRNQVYYLLTKLSRAAGVPEAVTPHGLRHTAATAALNEGISLRDVQTMLGHRDPRTTNRYDRARQNLQRSPTRRLDELFEPPIRAEDDAPADDEHPGSTR